MLRQRVTLTLRVEVDLDPVPGAFHTKEDAQLHVEHMLTQTLRNSIPHYNPLVKLN